MARATEKRECKAADERNGNADMAFPVMPVFPLAQGPAEHDEGDQRCGKAERESAQARAVARRGKRDLAEDEADQNPGEERRQGGDPMLGEKIEGRVAGKGRKHDPDDGRQRVDEQKSKESHRLFLLAQIGCYNIYQVIRQNTWASWYGSTWLFLG